MAARRWLHTRMRRANTWRAPFGVPSGGRVDPYVAAMWEELRDVRRDIHAHPELGLEERRTSALVADTLRRLGMDVATGFGKTGVVGSVHGTGQRDPDADGVSAIGIRADMDCLPMQEESDIPHRSKFPGKMHACGHDGHTTIALGAAHFLATHRDLFAGTVHFLFQPAEENHGGAEMMINDGVLSSKFICDEVYGIHNWPYLPPGTISVREGPIMASNDEFDISIRGNGGHAAMPHLAVDPVVVACQVVSALQSVVSRGVDPIKSGVLSVTQINGGSAYNVIPETVTLKGTFRTFRDEDRDRIATRLENIASSVAEAHGATAVVQITAGYPATVNAEKQTAFARQAASAVVGAKNVVSADPTMGSEDFSYMLQRAPGCYAWIGADSPGMLHEDTFDFDDEIIPIGVQYFVNLAKLRLPALPAGQSGSPSPSPKAPSSAESSSA